MKSWRVESGLLGAHRLQDEGWSGAGGSSWRRLDPWKPKLKCLAYIYQKWSLLSGALGRGEGSSPFCAYIPGRGKLGGDNVLGAIVMETVLSPFS